MYPNKSKKGLYLNLKTKKQHVRNTACYFFVFMAQIYPLVCSDTLMFISLLSFYLFTWSLVDICNSCRFHKGNFYQYHYLFDQ